LIQPDLRTNGFNQRWGHTRSYSNRLDTNYTGPNGDRWFIEHAPQLQQDPSGNVAVIGLIHEPLWFTKSGSPPNVIIYIPRHFIKETLVRDSTVNHVFTLTDAIGRVFEFYD